MSRTHFARQCSTLRCSQPYCADIVTNTQLLFARILTYRD